MEEKGSISKASCFSADRECRERIGIAKFRADLGQQRKLKRTAKNVRQIFVGEETEAL